MSFLQKKVLSISNILYTLTSTFLMFFLYINGIHANNLELNKYIEYAAAILIVSSMINYFIFSNQISLKGIFSFLPFLLVPLITIFFVNEWNFVRNDYQTYLGHYLFIVSVMYIVGLFIISMAEDISSEEINPENIEDIKSLKDNEIKAEHILKEYVDIHFHAYPKIDKFKETFLRLYLQEITHIRKMNKMYNLENSSYKDQLTYNTEKELAELAINNVNKSFNRFVKSEHN